MVPLLHDKLASLFDIISETIQGTERSVAPKQPSRPLRKTFLASAESLLA
jgi:hypothetical protein